MSRINTNIPSLVAQRVLRVQTEDLSTSLYRLSTGYRINAGKDDPAGLIASENLRAEKTALQAALTNISRANNVVATAEGGLTEINKLLVELEDLVDRSANESGISQAERNANQSQIDAILDSINRIAKGTEFQGRKLLSGELAYTTSGVTAASDYFAGVVVNAARLPEDGFRTVNVRVTASAHLGELTFSATEVTASGTGGAATIQINGNLGSETFTFGSGTTIQDMADAINQATKLTGVSAVVGSAAMTLRSTQYGSSQFVSVKILDNGGTNFATVLSQGDAGDHKDYGRDAGVKINGVTAIVDGLRATVRTQALSVDVTLTPGFGTLGTAQPFQTFHITGGGANFMISPTVNQNGAASMGIQAVDTGTLGDARFGWLASLASGQSNDLASGNFGTAQQIIRAGQNYVSELRGRLGGFQKNTLETAANALRVTLENTAAAEASIRETDFASETSNLTRTQILVQAASTTLRLANATPQMALALLG